MFLTLDSLEFIPSHFRRSLHPYLPFSESITSYILSIKHSNNVFPINLYFAAMSGVRKRLVKTKTRYGSVCGHIDEEKYDTISVPESLPADQDHPISQIWRKEKVGEAIISVLEKNTILFDAVDFLRRPRLMSYFNSLSDGKFCKNDDSHTIVITVTEFRAFDPKFNKIMDEIHERITGWDFFHILACIHHLRTSLEEQVFAY